MTKANSTGGARAGKSIKPKKPHKDFPLTPHPSGLWCKKVKGTLYYFGSWRDDPKGTRALDEWLADKENIFAGQVRRSRTASDEPTLGDLVQQFLRVKMLKRDSRELSPHTWNGYADICDELLEAFGAGRLLTDILPEDFDTVRAKWATRWKSPVTLSDRINKARIVFNFAYKRRLIKQPVFFADSFDRPEKSNLQRHRNDKGVRMFEADELRRIIDAATQPLKAMFLLATNAALGNADIARLPFKAIDLEKGWLIYPRGKTGVQRRCPLWPETIAALKEWIERRPMPKDPANADLVFITARRNAFDKGTGDRAIGHECRKLLAKLKITGTNKNFYACRHTFETIAGECHDQVAVSFLMGHAPRSDDMSATYRERISDERLQDAVNFVREWLYAKPEQTKTPRLKIADEGTAASA